MTIATPFQQRNSIQNTQNISLDIKTIENICAAATFNGSIDIYDIPGLAKHLSLPSTSVVTAMKFESNTLLWASYKSGKVVLWDLRTNAPALNFEQEPVSCFDINCDKTLLACGTDLVGEDAYIKFWDVRSPRLLAQFDEVHSDDVTNVKFHPNTREAMISGSTDGLVCLYNLQQFDQDEALYQVIKDESVSKVGYFGPNYEYIYSLTHLETFSIWKFFEGEKVEKYGDVRRSYEGYNAEYLIDCCYKAESERLFLVTGNRQGSIGILDVTLPNLNLAFTLHGHDDIVRSIDWQFDRFMSAGEEGKLILWTQ